MRLLVENRYFLMSRPGLAPVTGNADANAQQPLGKEPDSLRAANRNCEGRNSRLAVSCSLGKRWTRLSEEYLSAASPGMAER